VPRNKSYVPPEIKHRFGPNTVRRLLILASKCTTVGQLREAMGWSTKSWGYRTLYNREITDAARALIALNRDGEITRALAAQVRKLKRKGRLV